MVRIKLTVVPLAERGGAHTDTFLPHTFVESGNIRVIRGDLEDIPGIRVEEGILLLLLLI